MLQLTTGPAAGPMASWTSLFFPIENGLVFQPTMGPAAGPVACPRWVQQLDQWHAGQACFSKYGSGLALQLTMGPASGPIAYWSCLFFPIGELFDPPAHDGSSSWANGLVDKLVLPKWERFQPNMGPATGPMACWTSLFLPIGAV